MGVNRLEILVGTPDDRGKELIEYNIKHYGEIVDFLLINGYDIKLTICGDTIIIEFMLNPDKYGGPHLEWVEDE